jgi:GNAT superfamily N-acetyltransferase
MTSTGKRAAKTVDAGSKPESLRNYSTRTTLRDGTKVTVRAISPGDKERLRRGFHRLSATSVKFRFLGLKKELSLEELVYLTEIDFDAHVALVTTIVNDDGEEIIGVGRFIETGASAPPRSAEIGLAVVDEYHNRGIGTLLFEEMKGLATGKGISRFEAWVLSDNCRMCDIFRHHASDYTCTREDNVYHITCCLP